MLSHLASQRHRSTHSSKLERWLGREAVQRISDANRGFPWPIAVHGVPGAVYATGDGDFIGEIAAGDECSSMDRAQAMLTRHRHEQAAKVARHRIMGSFYLTERMMHERHAFASLSALISARTGGKGQDYLFQKTGVASNAIGNSNDLWVAAGQPGAGAAGSAAPGGKAWTNSDAGNMGFKNPVNANTAHFVTGWALASVINNTLLLYDRLFSVVKTMASTATQAVTGTFSRYQSQTTTNSDFIGGNFCFPSNPTTVLAATAHNWTVCQYTDDAGNTAQSFPSATGVSACVVQGIDLAAGAGSWFMPLAAGDVGVKALSQMQCSASVATGTIDFNVGHPIVYMPCPVANLMCPIDGINTAFNLQYIFDNACLALLELSKPATTATTYSGQVTAVAE